MNISFENKVALVTGAGSGLGLATAKAFAESGASVVLADANEEAVCSTAEGLSAQGHKALAIRCDVADDAQVEAMIERTVAHFGGLMRPITMPAFRMLLWRLPIPPEKTLTA
jgi:NAD(P)-dependent dehydrogenase (short-subunit alcohol dehydrogenase family)